MAPPTTPRRRTRGALAVLAVALAPLAMLALAPTAAGAQPHAPQNLTVPIRDFAFSSADLMVSTGDTVTWVNEDRAPHDVTTTSAPGTFASGTLKQGQSFSYTFTAPGSYSYRCTIHPDMVASVTAMDHSAAPAPAPAPAEALPPPPEAPADDAPAAGAPAGGESADSAPAAGVPAGGTPTDSAATGAGAGGVPTATPGVPAGGAPAVAVPAPGAEPAPVATQVVGAAQQGRQLDPMLIVFAVALGVATLCLLMIVPRSTNSR